MESYSLYMDGLDFKIREICTLCCFGYEWGNSLQSNWDRNSRKLMAKLEFISQRSRRVDPGAWSSASSVEHSGTLAASFDVS